MKKKGEDKEDLNNKENKKLEVSPGTHVVPIDIVPEMRESYLDYAMSVIVSRALPDVRDGLKPVHRRILYSMYEMGLTANARFRKSANVVGDVMAKYHPHGDAAIYDTMAKMAQDFSYRYPLVEGQGNFGSLDGDRPAAHRYTEARLAKISLELLRDIEKDTVNFRPNYDNTKKEPWVLPSVVPNLLLNGTLGIAVGMATKIPPHNLGELIDALILLIDNPNATTEDILKFIQGPDFPTGGLIFNKEDIHHAYATGRGGVLVRGETEIFDTKNGGTQIVVSSIPYQVNKADLIIKIADLVRDKKIDGIRDIRDESTKDVRIVIDVRGGAHPQKIINALYKHTDLENTFHFNVLALSGGVPRLLTLKEVLDEFLTHRMDVVTRRTKFDLARAEERAHILEGLKKALDHIDEVIKTIRASKDAEDAGNALIKKFKLSKRQVTAILEMKLSRLARLEREKIEEELSAVLAKIKQLAALLKSKAKLSALIKSEFLLIKERFGDPRRTRVITTGARSISIEDMVPDVENVLVVTSGGYVKRTDPREYRKQKRGGSGVIDMSTKAEDFVNIFITAHTHSDLLFFTDRGKVYQMKMYDVPEGKRATKGKSIANFLTLATDERVTSVLAVSKDMKKKKCSVLMTTTLGVVKKVDGTSFQDVRKSGIVAIKLGSGDKLYSAVLIQDGDSVLMVTSGAQAIRFGGKDVRVMGRGASGVRAIKMHKGDHVVSGVVVPSDATKKVLLVISERGYGKKSKLSEYKLQKRGGSGIKTARITVKTGSVIGAALIDNDDAEILAISKEGQIIRISQSDVPILGRQTQGVRIMKLRAGDSLASFTCL